MKGSPCRTLCASNNFSKYNHCWGWATWRRAGLTATPNVNLVSNIGFGADSTHTASASSPLAKMPTAAIGAIEYPDVVAQDAEADRYVFDHTSGGQSLRFPYSLLRLPRRVAGFPYHRLKRSFA